MKIDFKDYFYDEFKRTKTGYRLYHDWLYDKVFGDLDVPKSLTPIIKRVIFRASYSSMMVGEIVKVDYQRECERRVKAPSGVLKGKTISRLPEDDRGILPPLYELLRSNDQFVRKAAHAKIEQIKFYTDNE